jgi:serine protease Do
MNTAIRGLNRGIGFAIPVNLVRETADQLIDTGRVVYPWIGISIEPLADNKELLEMFKGTKQESAEIGRMKGGVVVREIKANTPAARSDLKQADIIVGVDGVPVKTPKELQLQILHKKVGQTVALDIIRDGKPIQIAIQTAEMNEELRTASRRSGSKPKSESAFGLNVQTLTKDLAKQFEVGEAEGIVVTDVAEGSPAAQKGLQRGDVITEVNRLPVRNAEDFRAAMDKADAGKGVLIFLKHNGGSTFVVLKEK